MALTCSWWQAYRQPFASPAQYSRSGELEALTRVGPGLVLIGGATGSRKTTTLATLVDIINRRDRKHIITIEDPIEYEHGHQASIVERIEMGTDCPDFATALRHVVRQAPDVLVLGEMRDPETMKTALAAAETVLSTLHLTDVTSTIGRIADSGTRDGLTAVLTQQLVPRGVGEAASLRTGRGGD